MTCQLSNYAKYLYPPNSTSDNAVVCLVTPKQIQRTTECRGPLSQDAAEAWTVPYMYFQPTTISDPLHSSAEGLDKAGLDKQDKSAQAQTAAQFLQLTVSSGNAAPKKKKQKPTFVSFVTEDEETGSVYVKDNGRSITVWDACRFCKKNGMPEEFYRNHVLRDEYGKLRCPVLGKHRCFQCGKHGHTPKFCYTKRKAA